MRNSPILGTKIILYILNRLLIVLFNSIRAIDAISACAVHLANGRVYPPTPVPREPGLKTSDSSSMFILFFLIPLRFYLPAYL